MLDDKCYSGFSQLLYYLWTTIQTCICCEHHKYIGLDVGPLRWQYQRPADTRARHITLAHIPLIAARA